MTMRIIFLLITLFVGSCFLSKAIDPAPNRVSFELNDFLVKNGAYIDFSDSNTTLEFKFEDRHQKIKADTYDYIFFEPTSPFQVKIKLNDSTEISTGLISTNDRCPIYGLSREGKVKIRVEDLYTHKKNMDLLSMIGFLSIIFLLFKLIPSLLILLPKHFLKFVKWYCLPQLFFLVVFALLVFFAHGVGLLISMLMAVVMSFAIDGKIIRWLYADEKRPWQLNTTIIISAALTLIFCFIEMVAFVLFI